MSSCRDIGPPKKGGEWVPVVRANSDERSSETYVGRVQQHKRRTGKTGPLAEKEGKKHKQLRASVLPEAKITHTSDVVVRVFSLLLHDEHRPPLKDRKNVLVVISILHHTHTHNGKSVFIPVKRDPWATTNMHSSPG